MEVEVSRPAAAGDLVKAERERLGLTLTQLGRAVGTSAGTLSRIEHGVHYPRRGLAKRLSELLGLPIERLYA